MKRTPIKGPFGNKVISIDTLIQENALTYLFKLNMLMHNCQVNKIQFRPSRARIWPGFGYIL